MNTISEETIEKAKSEVKSYSLAQLEASSKEYFESQPHIIEFITQFTDDYREEISRLALYISLVIWRAMKKGAKKDLKKIPIESIKEILNKNESEIGNLKTTGAYDLVKYIKNNNNIQQVHLLKYILDEILEKDIDFSLSTEEEEYLFCILKTIVDSINMYG